MSFRNFELQINFHDENTKKVVDIYFDNEYSVNLGIEKFKKLMDIFVDKGFCVNEIWISGGVDEISHTGDVAYRAEYKDIQSFAEKASADYILKEKESIRKYAGYFSCLNFSCFGASVQKDEFNVRIYLDAGNVIKIISEIYMEKNYKLIDEIVAQVKAEIYQNNCFIENLCKKEVQIEVIRNDITNMQVDAVVLPANKKLKEGKGTSNAIYEKAGRRMLEKELKQYGTVNVGEAVPTLGYDLNADFIIHAVVPKWKNGKHHEYELLCAAYLSALNLADNMGCEEIAFPLLASGNNGFDLRLAYEIAFQSFTNYEVNNKLRKIYLVVYDRDVLAMLREKGVKVEEYIDEKYILRTTQERKLPMERVIEWGKDIAQRFVDDGVEMAKMYIEDSENRKDIIYKAVQLMKDSSNQKIIMEKAYKITKMAIACVRKK